MRSFFIFILFFLGCSVFLFGQFEDTVIYKSKEFIIIKRFKTNKYTIRNELTGQLISDLKYINKINKYFQVLDNNKIYYLNNNFEKSDSINDFFEVCGTVPHYNLYLNLVDEDILIMEDETFYDSDNEDPAVEIARVSKKQADKVIFINGEDKFNFTSNFGVATWNTINPRTIVLIKNGKYSFLKQPEVEYDTVFFSQTSWHIKTQKNNLYGYCGVVEPKYKSVSEFKYFLAKVTFVDGKTGFIDCFGNEYK